MSKPVVLADLMQCFVSGSRVAEVLEKEEQEVAVDYAPAVRERGGLGVGQPLFNINEEYSRWLRRRNHLEEQMTTTTPPSHFPDTVTPQLQPAHVWYNANITTNTTGGAAF